MTDVKQWKPATAEVTFPTDGSPYLNGEAWPDDLILQAWERNEKGERRIKAEQRYVKANE